MHTTQPVRRIPFLSALIFGATAIAMTLIVSVASIVFYGMTMVDRKTDTLTGTVRQLLEELPAIRAALPPALADAISDTRRPDYASHLKIEAAMPVPAERGRPPIATVAVENSGDEVVSLLAVRVIALDAAQNPVREWTEYLATPLALDGDWRGPLMPGSTRRAVLCRTCPKEAVSVECEVTELRVWDRDVELERASASLGS